MKQFRCVHCEHKVVELFKTYSATIVLTNCDSCKKTCDPYVELPWVVLCLDMLLLKPPVFRHLLLNTSFSAMVMLQRFSLLLLVDSFVRAASGSNVISALAAFEGALFFALKCVVHVALVFAALHVVGFREDVGWGTVVNSFLVGSICPKSVNALALVWEYSHLTWAPFLLDLLVVLSRGIALTCVAKMSLFHCVALTLGLFLILAV